MIKYFAVENFRSIKNENILEFDVDVTPPFIAYPVVGFAGANASGKTTILQALTFVLWFMANSFLQLEDGEVIPIEPFRTRVDEPVKFHIIFSLPINQDNEKDEVDYEYELIVTRRKVLVEKLRYAPLRKGSWRLVYKRTANSVMFGNTISKIRTKDLRSNASIVSFAAQFASQKIAARCKEVKYFSNVSYSGEQEIDFNPAEINALIENHHERLPEFLRIADIGIRNIHVQEATREEIEKLFQIIDSHPEQFTVEQKEILESLLAGESENGYLIARAVFEHTIDERIVEFEAGSQSSGTRKFLALLHKVLTALEDGAFLLLDEIELKLHQNLIAYLIGLFQNPHENRKGAQLFFTFHNSSLMQVLEPAQLWLTEKNDKGHTEIFSAIDFEDLKNISTQDLETLYRIGRFGAKPRGI